MFLGRVLVITGAGVSAESGIPTFRGNNGYWRNVDPAKLATPEAFARDPKLVWEWYCERRERIRNAKPNAAHEAIVELAQQSGDFLLVTQNVDDLHARAQWHGKGLGGDQMVQIHGDIFVTRCSRCKFRHTEHERAKEYDQDQLSTCPKCGALMRPGVVWFGEQLDRHQIERVEAYLDKRRCDAVIVVGTTAIFSYIIDWTLRAAGENGRLIEVNPEETRLSPFAREWIREPAAVAVPALVTSILSSSST
jgi:NAD-dependent deacetylase